MSRLSQDKIDYIFKHKDDLDRKGLARKCGCNESTIFRYIEKFGGKKYPNHYGRLGKTSFPNIVETIREYYPTHTSVEIAEIIGCTPATIRYYVRTRKITRSEEETEEIRLRGVARASIARKWGIDKDRKKMTFGLEPKNKTLLKMAPKQILSIGWRLKSRYGYSYTEDPYVLKRNKIKGHPRFYEEYYTKRYNIKFID